MRKLILFLLMFWVVTPLLGTWTYISTPTVTKTSANDDSFDTFDLTYDKLNIEDKEGSNVEIKIAFTVDTSTYTDFDEINYYSQSTDSSNLLTTDSSSPDISQSEIFSIREDILDGISGSEGTRDIIVQLYFEDEAYSEEETIEIKYDLLRPDHPDQTKVDLMSGDRNLKVSWEHVDDDDDDEHAEYYIHYIAVDDNGDPLKDEAGNPVEEEIEEVGNVQSKTITGLSNNVNYQVEVFALDDAKNRSEGVTDRSVLAIGMPEPVDDLAEHYHKYGGEEEGCDFGGNSNGGYVMFLILIAVLLYKRREEGGDDVA